MLMRKTVNNDISKDSPIQYFLHGLKENYFLRDPRGKSRTGKMGHLAARIANLNVGFALSFPLADSAI